jgi:hypothetical protein
VQKHWHIVPCKDQNVFTLPCLHPTVFQCHSMYMSVLHLYITGLYWKCTEWEQIEFWYNNGRSAQQSMYFYSQPIRSSATLWSSSRRNRIPSTYEQRLHVTSVHPWVLQKCRKRNNSASHDACPEFRGNNPRCRMTWTYPSWIGKVLPAPNSGASTCRVFTSVRTASSTSPSKSSNISPGTKTIVPPWPPITRCATYLLICDIV